MDKFLKKDYILYLFAGLSFLFFSFAAYKLVSNNSANTIYVLDIKKVVDEIRRDYLISSGKDLSNASKYEALMEKRFKLLDTYLRNKNVIVYEKSAIVYYPKGLVVDLTSEVIKILELEDEK